MVSEICCARSTIAITIEACHWLFRKESEWLLEYYSSFPSASGKGDVIAVTAGVRAEMLYLPFRADMLSSARLVVMCRTVRLSLKKYNGTQQAMKRIRVVQILFEAGDTSEEGDGTMYENNTDE